MDLTFLSGPIGGALVAACTALGTIFLTQRYQWRVEVEKDARQLRDARRERLRKCYLAILSSLSAHTSLAPVEDLQSVLAEQQLILKLEGEFVVLQELNALVEALSDAHFFSNQFRSSDEIDAGRVESTRKIEQHRDALGKQMQAQLRELEQPFGHRRYKVSVPAKLGTVSQLVKQTPLTKLRTLVTLRRQRPEKS